MKGLRVTLIAVALLGLPFVAGAAQSRTPTRTRASAVRAADAASDCKDQQAGTLAQQQAAGHDPYGLDKKCDAPVPQPPPNLPPVANFTSSCTGLDCNFTSTSSDPDGSVASYAWTFGDGGTSTLASPSNIYSAAGNYSVSLTVTDNQGAHSSTSVTIIVTALPPPPEPPPSSGPPSGINGAQGTVYEDIDGNGSRDPFAGEMGLAGWTVQLLWSGQVIQTATTQDDGSFSFSGLGNGPGASYEICIVAQAGYVQTSTPPASQAGCGGSGYAFSFSGAFQQVFMPADFGMQATP